MKKILLVVVLTLIMLFVVSCVNESDDKEYGNNFRYHATCYSNGTLIYEGDVSPKEMCVSGFAVYTICGGTIPFIELNTGNEVTLPVESCVFEEITQ